MGEPTSPIKPSVALPPGRTARDPDSSVSRSTTLIDAFRSSDYHDEPKTHLLLCASGSVATIKIPLICEALSKYSTALSIRLIFTSSASQFLQGQSDEQPTLQSISQIPGVDGIYTDADEWAHPWSRLGPAGSVPILHIELRRWADIMVIAPLSANTMAKIVAGMADGLLTSVVRAWDSDGVVDSGLRPYFRKKEVARLSPPKGIRSQDQPEFRIKKILLCPAMNTAMWRQPITKKHIERFGYEFQTYTEVLKPESKELACGDTGDGAMVDWRELVRILKLRTCVESAEEQGVQDWGERRRYFGYDG